MTRTHRWLLWIACAALLLPVLLCAVVLWWFDPNQLRPEIEKQARARLGIPLQLTGPLTWMLWPRPIVHSGAGAVLPAADGSALLRWDSLDFVAQWSVLARHRYTIDGLVINGLQLQLRRDRNGAWNWDTLLKALAASAASAANAPANSSDDQPVRIGTVQLNGARLEYLASVPASSWRFDGMNATFALQSDSDHVQWLITGLALQGTARGARMPAAGVPVSLNTEHVAASLSGAQVDADSADFAPVQLRVANASLTVSGTHPLHWNPWVGEGDLSLQSDSLRTWLTTLGIATPPTRDASVYAATKLSTHWQLDEENFTATDLELGLDDTLLRGSARYAWSGPAQVALDLQGDALNLDRYLRPRSDPGKPFRLPATTLRALPLNGTLRFQRLAVGGSVAHNARIDLHSTINATPVRKR